MSWIADLLRRRGRDRQLREEMETHIAERTSELIEGGMPLPDARLQAMREFGRVTHHLEASREIWGWLWLEIFIRDLRYGLRMLSRNPGFTAAALLSLTLGIGASCAIFSVLNALLLTPLPYRSPETLVEIYQTHPRLPAGYRSGTSLADLMDWKAHSAAFEDFTAWDWTRHHVEAPHAPVYLHGLRVAENFFPLLGASPFLGRGFTRDDFRLARPVIVLSHRLWITHFAGDAQLIGRTIRLDEKPYEVLGVMPPRFHYPPGASQVPGLTAEMWEPLIPTAAELHRRGDGSATVLGRLRRGYDPAQAKAELDAVAEQLARKYPETNAGWKAIPVPLADSVTGHLRPALLLLLAAVLLVLLIACANVANLLLARTIARQHDIALRIALGASRIRLLAQTIAENLVVAVLGGAMGLVCAHWALRALIPFFPHHIPRIDEIGIDTTVLVAALAISLFTAIGTALAPAFTSLTGSRRLTNAFVVMQVAVSIVLLVGAALMLRTLSALYGEDMGFRSHSVLTVRLSPPAYRYRSWDRVRQFHRQILEVVRSQDGVASAALVMNLPLSGRSIQIPVGVESSSPGMRAEMNAITPEYFDTMQIPLWRGRPLERRDGENAEPVVVINRKLARRLWPAGDPIGRKMRVMNESRTVVGVVQDEKHFSVDREAEPKFYIPYEQNHSSRYLMGILTFLVIRTSGDPLLSAPQTRRAVWSVDRAVPVDNVKTMNQLVADSIAVPRFRAMLLGSLALLALVVSTIGVYGVMAYSVSRRTREIGISMALGAGRRQILSAVLLDGLRLAGAGIVAGLLLSPVVTRLIQNQLFGVRALDPLAFGGAATVMLSVAVVACLIPAWSAMRVDPVVALRHD